MALSDDPVAQEMVARYRAGPVPAMDDAALARYRAATLRKLNDCPKGSVRRDILRGILADIFAEMTARKRLP